MNVIRMMLPWIIYTILTSQFRISSSIAIIISAGYLVFTGYEALKKKYIVTWMSLICFVFLFIMSLIPALVYLSIDPWLFSNLALSIIAFASLVLKKPFTMQYAKENVSREKWTHPLFYRINYNISKLWGIIFSICFLCHILTMINSKFSLFAQILIYTVMIWGAVFTSLYPKYVRRHAHKTVSE